jgi:hypothetical protein
MTSSAPLALADGGAVLERAGDLIALDGSGAIRARVSGSEAITEPLFVLGDSVVAVSSSGAVHLWAPGGELVDSGTFNGRTQGVIPSPSAAHTLTAVVDGRLVDLDLVRKLAHVRAEPSRGSLSGPPLKVGNDVAAVVLDGSHVDLWQVGPEGDDRRRVNLAVVSALVTDSGIETLGAGFAAIADDVGTVAFVIPSGPVGVIRTDGSVTTAASQCNTGRGGTPSLQAVAPPTTSSGGAALLVACANGNVQELASSQK